MFANIEDFLQELNTLKNEFFTDSEIAIAYKRIDKISLRIIITPVLFIDVYANTETKRYDFTLIKDNKRIFGYDNLKGWHYHPLNNPKAHIRCSVPSLKHILKEMIDVIHVL